MLKSLPISFLLFTEKTEENNNDEQGTWEENFGGNTDSKPRGPQAIAMDFTFVGTKYIYGVPEHADRFSLQDTSTSDPYRLVYTIQIHQVLCYKEWRIRNKYLDF